MSAPLAAAQTRRRGQPRQRRQARGPLAQLKCSNCREKKVKVRRLQAAHGLWPLQFFFLGSRFDPPNPQCLPDPPRTWPQKCDRCTARGLDCSPASVAERRARRLQLPDAISPLSPLDRSETALVSPSSREPTEHPVAVDTEPGVRQINNQMM